jgi:outer membrane murein-binding lipoprotein Lpp
MPEQPTTDTRQQPPEQLVRNIGGQPNIDLENRTVEFTVCTRALARDGGIVIPEGIDTRFYETNPVVGIRHFMPGFESAHPLVAGRALSLVTDRRGLMSRCQFADTELGREWGYLYGLNEERTVYMRAVSFGWSIRKSANWTLDQARDFCGDLWDDAAVPAWCKHYDEVWVSLESEMHEYSLVEVGADRNALSRALGNGIRAAGEIMTHLDLTAARQEINQFKTENTELGSRMAKLEQDIQALSRDGADAAANGNSSAILTEIRTLTAQLGLQDEINELNRRLLK